MSSDKAEVSAVYGPNMALRLALGPNDSYEFVLNGNEPPLFPRVEMGRWKGQDPAGVGALMAAIASCSEPDNPSAQPGLAYVRVGYDDGLARRVRLYSLYGPPAGWARVQSVVLAQVHGAWFDSRLHTLQGHANWLRPKVDAKDSPMASIELESTGQQMVSFSSPVRAQSWSVTLVPQGSSPAELDAYPYTLEPHEVVVASPMASTTDTHELPAGKKLGIMVTLRRRLRPGRYGVTLRYMSEERRGVGSHASGTFTLELPVLEVRSGG